MEVGGKLFPFAEDRFSTPTGLFPCPGLRAKGPLPWELHPLPGSILCVAGSQGFTLG